jgi:hypothetical protein
MDRRLGRPLPHQLPNPTRANPLAINLSPEGHIRYYSQFPEAIPYQRAYSHALLTRPPLDPKVSLDLHVLGLPPAFVLSQDQTLKLKHPKMFLTERPCTSSNPLKDRMLLLVVPTSVEPPNSEADTWIIGLPLPGRYTSSSGRHRPNRPHISSSIRNNVK